MQHINLFQYNIPADNHADGATGHYLNVFARWDSDHAYTDGRPMVFIKFIELSNYDLCCVKDWHQAVRHAESLAEYHFGDLAKQEQINQARAILAVEENPILERMIVTI